MEYANRYESRGRKAVATRIDEAIALLNQYTNEEHQQARAKGAPLNVRHIDGQATLFRGDHPDGSQWAGFSPKAVTAARAKVRAVADAASRPLVDARAKIARVKAAARAELEAS
jgi:hypothetical protein